MNLPGDVLQRILELAASLQQTPAPPFAEDQRARLVYNHFIREGLADVSLDSTGNVYGLLPGTSPAGRPVLVVSAHLDTVFPSSTNLRLSRAADQLSGPGIGDNALGLASLFGLVWMLQQRGGRLPGDVWLVADVGEEGLGNLRGMTAVVDRFGSAALA
jgi:tripeptide aminopeptidase